MSKKDTHLTQTGAEVQKILDEAQRVYIGSPNAVEHPDEGDICIVPAHDGVAAAAFEYRNGEWVSRESIDQAIAKAISAYQKPDTGIPASDLAIGVQASLDKADAAMPGITALPSPIVSSGDSLAKYVSTHLNDTGIYYFVWIGRLSDEDTAANAGPVNVFVFENDSQSTVRLVTFGGGATSVLYTVTHSPSNVYSLKRFATMEDIPTNVSELVNDVGFITGSVDDLVNYYLKSETYTKNEVNSLIDAIQGFSYVVVSELPSASAETMGVIYLLPSTDPQTQNVKDEFITVDNGFSAQTRYTWEQIGSTAIDLSDYVTDSDLSAALSDYTTTANLTTLLAGKQDTISDLSTIRSGASAGATAYQKPAGGIPKTDLASGVQTSLDLADSAVQATPVGQVTPEVNPYDYATRAELNQLGQEVNGFSWTSGKYLDKYNAEQTDAGWGYSDYVPYTSGEDVIWQWGDSQSPITGRAICFYNSSKQFLANGYWQASGSTGQKTIAGTGITHDAPNAAFLRASFDLSKEAFVKVGNVVQWSNQSGIEGDINALKANVESLQETTQEQETKIDSNTKLCESLLLPPELPVRQGFVRWRTKEIESGGSNNQLWVIYPNGQSVLRYKVGQASDIDTAVAFYNAANINLVSDTTFISGVRSKDGISEGFVDIPSTCKIILVGNRKDILADAIVKTASAEKELRDRIVSLDADNASLLLSRRQAVVADNPFRFKRFYGHLGIEDVNRECIIPSQSIFDILYTKKLGFDYIEGNVRATSDGKAIVTHGVSGKFGGMFKLNPESTETDDVPNTLINTKTLDWIKTNVVYNSSKPRFCVAPLTPAEFVSACKAVGILPMIQVYNKEELDAIMGVDNYLADRLTIRGDVSAPILLYNPSITTKADILAACDAVGKPVGFTFTNNLGDYTDAQLEEIVEAMHSKGYMVGMVACYQNDAITQRGWRLGFDYACSNYQVNDFGVGNLLNIDGDVDYSEFSHTGTIANGILTLGDGQTIQPANPPASSFLSVGALTIKFTGTIKVKMGYYIDNVEYTSDGKTPMVISTYYCQRTPSFVVTGYPSAAIDMIAFKASRI